MSFSISPSTKFADIAWSNFENRPYVSGHFCTEKNWYDDVPCCMSGYTIEYINDLAQANGLQGTPEAEFLNEYPCVNGVETNYFYEKFTGLKAPQKQDVDNFYVRLMGCDAPSKPDRNSCFLSRVLTGIKELLF